MFFRNHLVLKLLLPVVIVAPLAFGSSACGPKQGPKVAAVQAGDLPEGGDWTGVYFSQTYGYLHLVKEGDTVSGKWRTTAGDAWGEMSGKVTGDLYKYEWKEHRIGMVGASATKAGRGYFKYSAPKANEAHEIKGQWGLGTDETGQTWEAVKQLNMKPNPDSVMPDEVERRGEGGGWDEDKGPKPPSGDSGGEEKKEGGDLPAPIE